MNSTLSLSKNFISLSNQMRNMSKQKSRTMLNQKDLKKLKVYNLGTFIEPYVPNSIKPSLFSKDFFSIL
jgi:hypothetical protein